MTQMSPSDLPFAVAFAIVFLWLTAVRLYYRRLSGDWRRPLFNPREGWGNVIFRWATGALLLMAIAGYFLLPSMVEWMFFPLPAGVRVAGVVASTTSVALIWWSHHALREDFSSTLETKSGHTLVTWGAYERMRHPMYAGYFCLFLGVLLFTRSWLIGGLGLLIIGSLMTTRLSREEKMLLEHFGSSYEEYMARTGRFLPKLLRSNDVRGRTFTRKTENDD